MTDDTIQVEFNEEQIAAMPIADKLNLIVKMTLLNHKETCKQARTLYGKQSNGSFEKGLCEVVRTIGLKLTWMYIIGSAVCSVFTTVLIIVLTKGKL